MTTLIDHGYLAGGDGRYDPDHAVHDSRTGHGHDTDYTLTPAGTRFLDQFGVQLQPRRQLVRYCIDWTEQRHHLAGAVGRGLRDRITALGWIRPAPNTRAVNITAAGRAGFHSTFGIDLEAQRRPTRYTKPPPAPLRATGRAGKLQVEERRKGGFGDQSR